MTKLQFQKIFAIALKDRQDRIVPLLQAANATNMTIQMVDGVKDVDVTEEQKPKVVLQRISNSRGHSLTEAGVGKSTY